MEFELINVIYATAIVFILFYIYKIPLIYYIITLGHLAAVFLTNDFLFPISYMPDQFRYIHAASNIRETLDFLNYYRFDRAGLGNVSNAALVFAVFPIPFLKSVFSIAIINFMIYASMFVFLYRKKILIGKGIWFYLLYPSFALYAAIGGRDTLILLIMILSVYYLYRGKTLLSIIISVPLIFIKFQNFFIFILSILLFKLIDNKKLFTIKNIFKISFVLIGLFIFMRFISIEEINIFRHNMYIEDGGDEFSYIPIKNYLDFVYTGILGGIYMLFKPLIWESHNALQLIQSFENLIIFYIIYKVMKNLRKVKVNFKYFLYIYFFVAMSIYGIVVFNFGSAARYKYTFITIFVIYGLKLIYKRRKEEKNEKNYIFN